MAGTIRTTPTVRSQTYYGRNLLTLGTCSSTSDTMLTGLGKLPSKEQQLSRTQHFNSQSTCSHLRFTQAIRPTRNTADPYDTRTELSPINRIDRPSSDVPPLLLSFMQKVKHDFQVANQEISFENVYMIQKS